jgi:aspartate racemase
MSFGGVVAFEMAQQLQTIHQKVGLLALLDSYPLGYSELTPITQAPRAELSAWRDRIRGHWKTFVDLPHRRKVTYLAAKFRTIRRRARSGIWRVLYKVYSRTGRALPDGLQNVKEANFLAAKEYTTKVYPGRVDLFIAREQSLGVNFDPMAVWSQLALGGVDIHEIPGNHVTLIEEPHVQVLAERLRTALERAASSP